MVLLRTLQSYQRVPAKDRCTTLISARVPPMYLVVRMILGILQCISDPGLINMGATRPFVVKGVQMGTMGIGILHRICRVLRTPYIISRSGDNFGNFRSTLVPCFRRDITRLIRLISILAFMRVVMRPRRVAIGTNGRRFTMPFPICPSFNGNNLRLLYHRKRVCYYPCLSPRWKM